MTLRWTTAFLDLPPGGHEAGAGFWSAVTGWARSPERGPEGQFTSLLPPTGTDYLRLQRLDLDAPRVHLDLHVEDPDTAAAHAVEHGAHEVGRPFGGVAVMRSPGGFTLCFVSGAAGERPLPTRWPDRTSYVDQVCLDIPPSRYAAELDFWSAVTGWERRDPRPGSEFGRLTPDADQPLQLLLQRLDDEQPTVTAHLDWAADDHEAEVAAHQAAGAEVQGRFEGWTVLRDPAGTTYCVTHRQPGDRP